MGLLNDIMLNVFRNFVSNKSTACDDKQPWINQNIKNKSRRKRCVYKSYKRNGKKWGVWVSNESFMWSSKLRKVRVNTNYCLVKGLNDPSASEKSCWPILKQFCNERKISFSHRYLLTLFSMAGGGGGGGGEGVGSKKASLPVSPV